MKKLLILLGVLILAILAFFILRKNQNSTIDVKLKDFALKNPEKVTKILYSPNMGKGAFLLFNKSESGNWTVTDQQNTTYEADTFLLNLMLYFVMKKVELKHPVGDSAKEEIVRELSTRATKAIFYEGDKMVKTVYVGSSTSNLLGTHMYLPGAERPCVVHVPAFQGYLSSYFNTQIQNWRSKVMLHFPPESIASIKVIWGQEKTKNFEIKMVGNTPVGYDGNGNKKPLSPNKMLAYLEMFKGVAHEAGEAPPINKRPKERDSLLQTIPYIQWKITGKDGKTKTLNIWRIPVTHESYSPEFRTGEIKIFETETYWANVSDSKEIWIMQDAVLKNKMKSISDF